MIVEIYKIKKDFYEIYPADLEDFSTSQFEINDDLYEEYVYLKSRMNRIYNQIQKVTRYQDT